MKKSISFLIALLVCFTFSCETEDIVDEIDDVVKTGEVFFNDTSNVLWRHRVNTIEDANKYIEEGHFAPGSMLPKVQAAMKFATSKTGRRALITSLEKAADGISGKTGTIIIDK